MEFNSLNFVTALNLTRLFSSVTLLEGNSITLSCTPSIVEVVLMWSLNGVDVMKRNDVIFSPPSLNHNLIITNPRVEDSGVYRCRAAIDDELIEQNITVNVIAGMYIAYYN